MAPVVPASPTAQVQTPHAHYAPVVHTSAPMVHVLQRAHPALEKSALAESHCALVVQAAQSQFQEYVQNLQRLAQMASPALVAYADPALQMYQDAQMAHALQLLEHALAHRQWLEELVLEELVLEELVQVLVQAQVLVVQAQVPVVQEAWVVLVAEAQEQEQELVVQLAWVLVAQVEEAVPLASVASVLVVATCLEHQPSAARRRRKLPAVPRLSAPKRIILQRLLDREQASPSQHSKVETKCIYCLDIQHNKKLRQV